MSAYTRPYDEREGSEIQCYESMAIEYRDASHRYWIMTDGGRVPAVSVTSALKVLDKPALISWAEACGAEGAAKLAEMGELSGVPATEAIQRVRLHGLGMEAKRDAGAERGTVTHRVQEHWVTYQSVPNLADFPIHQRGYVQGMAAFLVSANPKASSVERIVGSVKHKYAGRMDMRAVIDGRDCVVDFKTNTRGRVFDEAHLQSRAYSDADIECGNPPPEGILLVAIGEDGSFEMVECEAESGDWLSILQAYRTVTRLRGARQMREKIAKAAAA